MKIIKPTIPIEVQGALNRLNSEAEFRTDMRAKEDIPKGNYFILHDVLYQALRAIPKGSLVKPNENCVAKSLNELNGGN